MWKLSGKFWILSLIQCTQWDSWCNILCYSAALWCRGTVVWIPNVFLHSSSMCTSSLYSVAGRTGRRCVQSLVDQWECVVSLKYSLLYRLLLLVRGHLLMEKRCLLDRFNLIRWIGFLLGHWPPFSRHFKVLKITKRWRLPNEEKIRIAQFCCTWRDFCLKKIWKYLLSET